MAISRSRRVALSLLAVAVALPSAIWVWSFGGPQPAVNAPQETNSVARALFVMAHPDDEFGILGRMLHLHDLNTEIWCAWTIGGNQKRDLEARLAMREIGIPDERLRFLSLGGLSDAASVARAVRVLSELLEAHRFDEIYVVAYEGGHFQHDLTNFAVAQAAALSEAASRVYEFPLYNTSGLKVNAFRLTDRPGPVCGITLAPDRVRFIRSLTRHYPSQRHITEGFLRFLPPARQRQPRWRPLPDWDYTQPPHRGLLWHDANPRQRLKRSYRESVTEVVKAYRETSGQANPASTPK